MSIRLGHCVIGDGAPPLIVAEMSGNHNQSLERALSIVEAVARAGAHAVKLQTFRPETMTLDVRSPDFTISAPDTEWHQLSLYDLYKSAQMPWEWHAAVFQRCRELGVLGFSTAYDTTAVDFLETLDVPCYKIASFENVDIPLIHKIARTGKPIIMSTGMATDAELGEAVTAARTSGCENLVLLKCTTAYPARAQDLNVATIPDIARRFACSVGLSDHTPGIGGAVAAVAFGACLIEKHVTLRRSDGGVDAHFSLEPDELRQLVGEARAAWESIGDVKYGATEHELPARKFRRSLYISEDMKAGDTFTSGNVRSVRPGEGLAPKYLSEILGKSVRTDAPKGTPLRWELVAD